VDIQVWGRTAENCGEYLSKGSPALIEGRLQLDQWQTKEGEKRSKLRVRAERVQFLGRPKQRAEVGDAPEGSGGGGGGRGGRPSAPAPSEEAPPSAAEEKEDDLPF
jgi:single-strand DNA-binding protein